MINVLIDPSLMLAANSIANTFDFIRKSSKDKEEFAFYHPRSLQKLITKQPSKEESAGVKFFLHGAVPSDLEELSFLMKEYPHMIAEFTPTIEQTRKYGYVYEMLSEELKYRGKLLDVELRDTLFEELIFLLEESWMVSRIKKPFNRFTAAGIVCIQYSRSAFNILIRKTLKKKEDEPLKNVERLRALGKWIAAGAVGPALATIHPYLAGVIPVIFLFDPEQKTIV